MDGSAEEHITQLFSTAVDTALGYSNIMLESTEKLLKINIEAAKNRLDTVTEQQKVLSINEAMAAAYEIMEQARADITDLIVKHFEKTHQSAADLVRQSISEGNQATRISNELIESISKIAGAAQQQVGTTAALNPAVLRAPARKKASARTAAN